MFKWFFNLFKKNDEIEALGKRPRSPEWAKIRKEHLKKEPYCRACGTDECLEIHHIIPFHLSLEKELDPNNLITLCAKPAHYCHYRIGHLLSWTSYNVNVVSDADKSFDKIKNRP